MTSQPRHSHKPAPPPPGEIATAPEPMHGKVWNRVLEPDASRILAAAWALADEGPSPRFPGPSPVSLDRAQLPGLAARAGETYVCEKTDGTRYALAAVTYAGRRVVVLVDRALRLWLCPLRGLPRAMFQGSLLDGELAWNKRARTWTYLAFDALCLSGVPVFHARFGDRIRYLHRTLAPQRPDPADPCQVRVKEFVPATDWAQVQEHAARAAEFYDCDGLVFTPDPDPVRFGRHMRMYKWKDPAKHTVDFLAGAGGTLAVYDARQGAHVVVGRMVGAEAPRGTPPGAIVECAHVSGDVWRLVHVRSDKKTANDHFTYTKTLGNIREKLDIDQLTAAMSSN
jgi:hypothetical protein